MNRNELLESNPKLAKSYGKHLPKYGPKLDCNFCKGTGVKHIPKLNKDSFCICTFVHHDCSNEIGKSLGEHARRMLNDNPFAK